MRLFLWMNFDVRRNLLGGPLHQCKQLTKSYGSPYIALASSKNKKATKLLLLFHISSLTFASAKAFKNVL
jgi:hypothetical protein